MAAQTSLLIPAATPERRLNYFRGSQILVDHLSFVMRKIFQLQIENKYGPRSKWRNSPADGAWFFKNERWREKLSQEMQRSLQRGNCERWDMTLLFHTLLHSSHCLLMDKITGTQADLQKGSRVVKLRGSLVDVRRILRPGDVVVFDLGHTYFRSPVQSVRKAQEFQVSKPFPYDKTLADIYICKSEWQALERLSWRRNDYFAHSESCEMSSHDLNTLIQDVAQVYLQFQVPAHIIAQMKAIGKEVIGDAQLIQEIQKYQQLWMREHTYWKKVERDIEDMSASIIGIETDVQALKLSVPDVTAAVGSLQEDISGLKDKTTALHQALETKASEVSSNQQQLREAKRLFSSELEVAKDSLSVLARQREELTLQVEVQKKGVLTKFEEHNQRLSAQEKLVQEHLESHVALKTQHSNTAARVGYQARIVHALNKIQKDSESKLSTVQHVVSTLVQEQAVVKSTTTTVSGQVKAMEKQLSLTVSDVDKVKTEVKVLQSTAKCKQDIILGKLSPSFFSTEVEYYSNRYHPGTRMWIYDDLDKWLLKSKPNSARVCIITGNAGMGKSVIASTLCTRFQANGTFGGCFFFQYNKPRRSNGVALVHTLAHCFCQTIPHFEKELLPSIAKLDNHMLYSDNIAELFSVLVLEPLGRLQHKKISSRVVVLDALDECEAGSQMDILKLIVREFIKLPNWLSVIATTRPNKKVLNKLKAVHHRLDLDPNDPRNLQDITTYLKDLLKGKIADVQLDEAVSHLVQKSEGMFLYFYYIAEVLYEQESLTLQFIKEILPEGIDDYYDQNFQRLFNDLGPYYHTLLAAIIAARSGVPKTLVPVLLNCSMEVTERLISTLSVVFPLSNEIIRVLHASVKDWVTDADNAGEYVVSVDVGHRCLAQVGVQQALQLLEACPSKEEIADPFHRFTLEHTVFHSLVAKLSGNRICNLFCNIQFLYYRLLLERGLSGILMDSAALMRSGLSNAEMTQVHVIEGFLRRYSTFLSQNPELIFQFAMNELPTVGRFMDIQSVQQPQRVFHNLQAVLQLHVTTPRTLCLVAKKEMNSGVEACKSGPGKCVVVTSITEGKLLIWNWEKDEELEVSARRGVPCDVSIEKHTIICGDPFTKYDFNGVRSKFLPRPDVPIFQDSALFSPSGEVVLGWKRQCDIPYIYYSAIIWNLESGKGLVIADTPDRNNRLLSASYSPDSTRILSSDARSVLSLWDIKTGKKIATTKPLDTPLADVDKLEHCHEFFPTDHKQLILLNVKSDDSKKQAKPIDYPMDVQMLSQFNRSFKFQPSLGGFSKRTGTVKVERQSTVLCAFSPKGHFFAASQFLQIFIWDATSLELIQIVQLKGLQYKDHANWITDICFSPDGQYIVAITEGGVIAWWQRNVSLLQEIAFKFHGSIEDQGHLSCCTFNSTQYLIAGSFSGVCIYDFNKLVSVGTEAQPINAKHGEYVSCCAVGSQRFYTSGAGKLTSWSSDLQTVAATTIHSGDFLSLSPDNHTLVTYGSELYVDIWTTDVLSHVCTLTPPQGSVPQFLSNTSSDHNSCQFACISANNFVICGYESGQICIFYGPVYCHKTVLEGHEGDIRWIDCSRDGTSFISGDVNGVVFLWKVTEVGTNLSISMDPLCSHSSAVTEIHFSPILGNLSRAASSSHDGTLHLYHGRTGKILNMTLPTTANILGKSVVCFIFSPNGEIIASGCDDGSCHLWDGFTGAHSGVLKGHSRGIQALDFTKNSQYLASAGTEMICIWDITSRHCLTLVPVSDIVMFLQFSASTAESPALFCGSYDGVIHIMELRLYANRNKESEQSCKIRTKP